MAEHDYVIANQNGANTRSDLNNALAAIVSNNSKATAPTTTYAFMWWADTANDILKQRNAADSAWINILTLSTGAPLGALAASLVSGTHTNFTSTGIDDNATSTAITIDASENVGIGTASPSVNVHIVDDATEGTPTFAGATHFAVQATASSSDNVNAALISGSAGTSRIMFGDKDDEDIGKIEYNNSTNAMSITTNTATAMAIDNSGRVTMPLQPAFGVGMSADQDNFAVYGTRTVLFDTERYDVGSNFNTGTYTFTAPITGKYTLSTCLQVDNWQGGANWYGIHIITSNKTYFYYHHVGAGSSNNSGGFSIAFVADMDANDTAYVGIYQHGGGSTSDLIYTGCHFSGVLSA